MLSSTFSHPFDLQLFLSTFGLIFVAEFPDKTAFAIMIMATRSRPLAVFTGVAAAFLIQSLIAVCFGSLFALLPPYVVKISAALMFFVFAAAMWFKKEEENEEVATKLSAGFWPTTLSCFLVIFLAEWGDLTQLATATLQAKYNNPVTIFTSATLALWSATAVTIFIGHRLKTLINPHLLQKIAAVAFALVGVLLLIGLKSGH